MSESTEETEETEEKLKLEIDKESKSSTGR